MEINAVKDRLLGKPITDLGLGNSFNNYFERGLTLKEFFDRNKKFLTRPSDRLSCDKDGDGFSLQSSSFQRLKSFLIMKGFSQKDWVMLGTSEQQGNLFPSSNSTNKAEILTLRFVTLKMVKPTSNVFRLFHKLLPGVEAEDITISHILPISIEDIETITGALHHWKIDYDTVQSFRIFITKLQVKFIACGLTKKDGPFMDISFKKQKSPLGISNRAA